MENSDQELIVLNQENCEMTIRVVDFNFICCAHINRAMNRQCDLKKFTMFGGWLSPNKPHIKFFRPSQMAEGMTGHEMMRLNAEIVVKVESNKKLRFRKDEDLEVDVRSEEHTSELQSP